MRNLRSLVRPSTKILKDLVKNRKKLIAIENSTQKNKNSNEDTRLYLKNLKALLRRDYWLSHALIKILSYENNFDIKFKKEPLDKFEDEELF